MSEAELLRKQQMSDTTRKTVFGWASIAGADAEPVELIEVDGRKGLFTLGCADPFWLDDESAGIIVFANSLKRPDNPETQEVREAKQKSYEWHRDHANHGPDCDAADCTRRYRHGWRGSR